MTGKRRENATGDDPLDDVDLTGKASLGDQERAIRAHIRKIMLKLAAVGGIAATAATKKARKHPPKQQPVGR